MAGKDYRFDVKITEEGRVYIRHNCESLVEFLGVLEILKAVGLKMFSATQQQADNKSKVDPQEYLREIQSNTQVVKVNGITGLARKA